MGNGVVDYRLHVVAETTDDDAHLVRAAQEDLQAAGQLYDKYYERVFRYLFHSTLDAAVAEDLTANVFLAAFGHLRRFRWQRVPFGAWLYRIATNEVRMYYRRQGRAPNQDSEALGEVTAPSASQPEPRLVVAEAHRQLHAGLRELKPVHRTVIVLRYFEGKSIDEIAVVVGRRPGTVKSQLSRGLRQLQGILLRHGMEPESGTQT